MAHILLIEPSYQVARTTSQYLVGNGHQVSLVRTADQAIEAADKQRPDVVITELSLKGHSGFEFLYEFRTYQDWQSIPVIVCTTVHVAPHIQNSRSWQTLGVTDYIYKPTHSLHDLAKAIQNQRIVAQPSL